MSELQDLVRTHYDGFQTGDLDAAMSVFDPDVETQTPNGAMKGIDEFRALNQAFLTAAPDQRLEVLRTFEDGDTIIVEGTYSGTQTGQLVGPHSTIPATGKAFSFPYADILQVRDGKVISHRIYWDNATFLAQLGVLPG